MEKTKSLPVLGIDDVIMMAPELNAWAEMSARAFGLYSGINDAIKKSREKHGSVAHQASEIRQQMILMALIRAFAMMDREATISLQSVYRFLCSPGALSAIKQTYANTEPISSLSEAELVCVRAIEKFKATYLAVDFKAFARIQSFRNTGIAHISWPDAVKAKVTYHDVERLVRGCAEMSGQLMLMLFGRNDWPAEHLDTVHSESYHFWLAVITADHDGTLNPLTIDR